MIKIGLTGGYCGGKTTVAKMFQQLGAARICADEIVHDLLRNENKVIGEIVAEFGPEVTDPDGQIIRGRLADIVFEDADLKKKLEAIVHPMVMKEIRKRFSDCKKSGHYPAAVADVPLLLEQGSLTLYDTIIVVYAGYHDRLKRFMAKGGDSREQFDRREKWQMNLDEKTKRADYVIDNSGPTEKTHDQVIDVWNKIVNKP